MSFVWPRWSQSVSLRDTPVGQVASLLRRHMCECPDAVFFQRDVLRMAFPAFAALVLQSDRRQLHHYKAWVKQLAFKEYADELVVVATAQTPQVKIVCMPYTPESTTEPWAISTYGSRSEESPQRIWLRNNDVHHMWLAMIATTKAAPSPSRWTRSLSPLLHALQWLYARLCQRSV
jgi:hypothetical protein